MSLTPEEGFLVSVYAQGDGEDAKIAALVRRLDMKLSEVEGDNAALLAQIAALESAGAAALSARVALSDQNNRERQAFRFGWTSAVEWLEDGASVADLKSLSFYVPESTEAGAAVAARAAPTEAPKQECCPHAASDHDHHGCTQYEWDGRPCDCECAALTGKEGER